ncbi:cupin domain-containing protein [Emticicia sp. C21]|uniref:cupin domain-containing protein n=1 Tax=Emticicia sp. C21 TaxID=2302915 RepID=UPI000E34C16C|nr:cupin domain-containing protein [Emticicia sp. C21]RFS17552.1 cupin domain-containing protein [Emticicia sp. C21]
MRFKIIKKTAMVFLILLSSYLIIGNLLHRIVFPEEKPAVAGWFKPGQEFYSKAEGFRQTIVKQEDGFVHCLLEIEPFAGGPPKHIHTEFDEKFEIENGELTVWVNGEIKKIRPGEVLNIPKGTPHRPYNETADTIRIKNPIAFPEKFAFNLIQVYGAMDSRPAFEQSSDIAFRMAMFQTSGLDSYVAEGPPVFIQKAMGFVLAPALRLFGYRSYYKNYDPLVREKL